MADPYGSLEEGLRQGLSELFGTDQLVQLLERREASELVESGRRAVHLAVAPLIWDERLGPMLETAEVCERLGITRQAVAKAVDAGRLIALPAGNTRRFPIWQFNFGAHTEIRPQVAQLVSAFRQIYPEVRPLQVATWAMTPQPELKDVTPSTWMEQAQPLDSLLLAARRAASALSQ